VNRADETVAQLAVYRCRRCTALFNDDDWKLKCSAPGPHAGRPTKIDMMPPITLDELPPEYAEAVMRLKAKRQGNKGTHDANDDALSRVNLSNA